jgi:hypothetical protein
LPIAGTTRLPNLCAASGGVTATAAADILGAVQRTGSRCDAEQLLSWHSRAQHHLPLWLTGQCSNLAMSYSHRSNLAACRQPACVVRPKILLFSLVQQACFASTSGPTALECANENTAEPARSGLCPVYKVQQALSVVDDCSVDRSKNHLC